MERNTRTKPNGTEAEPEWNGTCSDRNRLNHRTRYRFHTPENKTLQLLINILLNSCNNSLESFIP